MTLEVRSDGVAEAPKQIVPLKIPAGVEPTAFRSIVAAYTTAWRTSGQRPNASQVRALWPRLSTETVGEIMVTPEFREALAGRGIDVGDTPGLSHVQHLALMALSDPHDRRSTKQKVEAVGATTQQLANWQRSPVWLAARRALAQKLWEDGADEIKSTMLQQAVGGSYQQQAFIMETLGEGPKARELQSAKEMVGEIIAAIQRATVGHPEIREAIMIELQATRMEKMALNQ